MKKRWLWILLGGIAALSAAFLFLDFHAAGSNTRAEKNIMRTSIGNQSLSLMQHKDKISIAVIGESPLVRALRRALAAQMHKIGMEDIEMAQGLGPAYQNPVLVVRVEKPRLLWTPFFATSRFSAQVGYAFTGDTTFMEELPVILDYQNGQNLTIYAEYQITDRSWGLISRPGYQQMLADYLARDIVAALKNVY